MTETRYTAHYISGTHWDREWYRPFQEFRLLLVELIDDLLDLIEGNTGFDYFHFDGQTCLLEDYLAIRPENRNRLLRLISDGRILIGPWFTMPDLFSIDEESLIRNFLTGRRISREWGVEPMPVAYTCDMFGHPSQMPQIYKGFDLQHCVLGRGPHRLFSTGRRLMAARSLCLNFRTILVTALLRRPEVFWRQTCPPIEKRLCDLQKKASKSISIMKYQERMEILYV